MTYSILYWALTGLLISPIYYWIQKLLKWPDPPVGPGGPFVSGRPSTRANPWITRGIGLVFGIGGGLLFNALFVGTTLIPSDTVGAFFVSGTGALLVSGVALDISSSVLAGRSAPTAAVP